MIKIGVLNIFIFFLWTNILFASNSINIATDTNSTYTTLAKSINRILVDNSDLSVKIVSTKGSVENIQKLLNKKVDFAIVQNDTVFFARNALGIFNNKEEGIQSVIPLFKEPIFILTRMRNLQNIKMIRNKKVVIGEHNSGLLASVKIILKSASLWDSVKKFKFSENDALDKIKNSVIDVMFVNNLTDEMKSLVENEKLFIIPLGKSFINKLNKTFPYFSIYKYTLNEDTVTTVSIYSFLITLSENNDKKVYNILKLLIMHFNELEFPNNYHTPSNELFKINSSVDWHNGVYKYFDEYHVTPKSNFLLDRYFWYIVLVSLLIGIFLFFALSIVLYQLGFLYTLGEHSNFLLLLRKTYLYAIKHKYILIVSFVIISYIISILVTKYFEHTWAIEHSQLSTFDEKPFLESLFWLFVFNSTGFNGNLFPISTEGKFIISLIPMVGFGGVLALVGLVTSDQIKKYILEGKGMSKVNFKNHIIICGWNERTALLIENLTHKNLSNKKPIVILTSTIDFNPVEKFNLNSEYVKYISGKGTEREGLIKANLKDAETAIVVSNPQSSDPDARTLLIVLTIESFCTELINTKKRIGRDQIYTIAELNDKKNTQIAKDAKVNQVITLGDIESKLFAQSIQSPGILKFINEVFNYNDFNDIYTIVVDNSCTLLDKKYDEALIALRKYNILLLTINVEARRDESEIELIKSKYDLTRTIITNPIHQAEQNYKINIGDILIVLSRYEKELVAAQKDMKKAVL